MNSICGFFKGTRMKEKNRNGYLLYPPLVQFKINEKKKKLISRILLESKDLGTITTSAAT